MGNCSTSEEAKISKAIDSDLRKQAEKSKDEVKLLLLGTGESGKSTVFKQMKIISCGGFSQNELLSYKWVVYGNCLSQMKILVSNCLKASKSLEEENKQRAEKLLEIPSSDFWTREAGEIIGRLWQDPAIRETYAMRDKMFQLNDSAHYFFENIERINEENYIPTSQDALRVRARSSGIEEASFTFVDLHFRMLDVGGQRSERRKWIHCFDQVTAVLFCVGLSEYDQTLREDSQVNRMQESLTLFDDVTNSHWFKQTAIILFLNKHDLFKEKVTRVDLKVCFEDYEGGCNYEPAAEYIRKKFHSRNKSPHQVYSHFTCAISTENIEVIFNSVRETLLREVLTEVMPTF